MSLWDSLICTDLVLFDPACASGCYILGLCHTGRRGDPRAERVRGPGSGDIGTPSCWWGGGIAGTGYGCALQMYLLLRRGVLGRDTALSASAPHPPAVARTEARMRASAEGVGGVSKPTLQSPAGGQRVPGAPGKMWVKQPPNPSAWG